MRVKTVREIVQKDGNKTTITIEDEMNGSDTNLLTRYLEAVGFYDSQTIGQKLWNFVSGGRR